MPLNAIRGVRRLVSAMKAVLPATALAVSLAAGPASARDVAAPDGRAADAFALCADCHSLTPGVAMFGPSLSGVVDRPAGSEKGFPYSPTLLLSGILWTEENLDRWLTDPRAFLPGSRMPFPGLPDPGERQAIIRFLKSPPTAR